jgi:hypothetical protein
MGFGGSVLIGVFVMVTLRVRSMVWFATGVVLTLFVTVLVMQTWRVDAAPGDTDSTFVPTSPCRLFDLRPAPHTVGPRPTPLGAGEVFTQQVTGSNGDCTGPLAIPADAVAVAMNVTAVSPTAQSNLRVFPADVATVPTVSNLNFSAGQKPVPNKVDVKLSPDGKIKLFNAAGSVSVVGDVVGYYTNSSLKELAAEVAALKNAQPFAATSYEKGNIALTATPVSYVDVTVAAPVDGQVTINYSMYTQNIARGRESACSPHRSTEIPADISFDDEGVGWWETAVEEVGDQGSVSGTRTFDISAGQTVTYSVACQEIIGNGWVAGRTATAIFTPAP